MKGPPFDKHPMSAEQIRAHADGLSRAKAQLESVATAMNGPAKHAADAVDGDLDGAIAGPTQQAQRSAMNTAAGSALCHDALDLFAGFVEVFDLGVADINRRWARAKAHDFYVREHEPDRHDAVDGARAAEAAALRKEYALLERDLDADAEIVATALNSGPDAGAKLVRSIQPHVTATLAYLREPEYVALGDSYSAGTGIGSYYTNGNEFRSTQAYAWLLARRFGLRLSHQATNGATTEDINARQLTGLGPDTEYVTLTAGGNDLEFSHILEASLNGDATQQILAKKDEVDSGEFEEKLDKLYAEVRQRAPNATVVVGTYPHLFDDQTGINNAPMPGGKLVSAEEVRALRETNDAMAAAIARSAAKYGFEVADVRDDFEGHSTEDVGRRWVNPLVVRPDQSGELKDGWVDADSYHPNAEGHHAYADAFDDHFGR